MKAHTTVLLRLTQLLPSDPMNLLLRLTQLLPSDPMNLQLLMIFWQWCLVSRKHDIAHTGKAISIDFRSTSFPAKESILAYRQFSLLCNFSPIKARRFCLEPLKHSGSPKYDPSPSSFSTFSISAINYRVIGSIAAPYVTDDF